ncbi:Heterokaryon incompatibility 6 OR allele protein [Rutstroemia sp. NJR-2017a BVV2]|nr:Heterokaryon incompatibility 6 OR allele protein [Rutstroemia sp. NJR-2017a BVV2]
MTGNIEEFFKQLPISELQQTLKDAIWTTRELGLRFLWIDALCIIQDSKNDMIKELSRMHELYANAYVTIIAASAKSCDEGFLQRRIQLRDNPGTVNFKAFSLPYRFQNGTLDEVTLQPFQSYHPDVHCINSRAWTLQENLLSPRILVYGSQLVRECFTSRSPAIGPGPFPAPQTSWLGRAPRRPPSPDGRSPSSTFDTVKHLQELQSYWIWVVNDYSERKLSYINDKLIAISALARQLSVMVFKDHSYKAGLWFPNSPNKTSFLHDLCWTTELPLPSRDCLYLAPSWSWASSHVQTSLGVRMEHWSHHTALLETGAPCEIVRCEIIAERENPFSHILGGSLVLRGILTEAKVSKIDVSESIFEIYLPGEIILPSELDRVLSFAKAYPSESVNFNLANADTTKPTFKYDLRFSANFDMITPELRHDSTSVSVFCLRVLRYKGLLLMPVPDQKYRRVGTFHYKDFVRVSGESRKVEGCFSGIPLTQVTIV